MADSEIRQRKQPDADAVIEAPAKKSKKKKKSKPSDEDEYTPWVDILRVLSFLFVASCALSYTISSGESFFWGMKNKPHYLRLDWWKAKLEGPIYLTDKELLAYNGQDESKPLYLAVNGTIFDVSNGRRMYGPGGGYSFFAGVDAARAYISGCFQEDLTPDIRGVEEMFLPLDDPEIDSKWTTAEMTRMKLEERAAAEEKAYGALKHWVDFFENSKKYSKVGYIRRQKDWLEKLPRRKLCKSAEEGRKKRTPRSV